MMVLFVSVLEMHLRANAGIQQVVPQSVVQVHVDRLVDVEQKTAPKARDINDAAMVSVLAVFDDAEVLIFAAPASD